MENFSALSGALKILKEPRTKQLIETLKVARQLLPSFTVKELKSEGKPFIAVLFEHNPANQRRVEAIEELFTDILPPFDAYPDFNLENITYSALVFPVESPKNGA